MSGLGEIRTLSGWGARYTEKKARREVSDSAWLGLGFFVRLGSRILRVVVAKKPDVVGLFGVNGVEGKARGCGPVKAAAEFGSGRHCASPYESTAKLTK